MTQILYALLKTTKPDPIIWKDLDDVTANIKRKFNAPTLDTPIINSFSSFLNMREKEMPLGYSPESMKITNP